MDTTLGKTLIRLLAAGCTLRQQQSELLAMKPAWDGTPLVLRIPLPIPAHHSGQVVARVIEQLDAACLDYATKNLQPVQETVHVPTPG
jgi:hypothetical protein